MIMPHTELMMKLLFLLCLPLWLFADKSYFKEKHPAPDHVQIPWFTGPLLAPSSTVVPLGSWYVEPYIFAIANAGEYSANWKVSSTPTFWNNYFQPEFTVGLARWMDIEFVPTVFYNYTNGAAKWSFGDFLLTVDFQLYNRKVRNITDWGSNVKLILRELVPNGKFQNLNPAKLATDASGEGSWQTAIGVVWGNLNWLGGQHFISSRVLVQYTIPAPCHVKNLNAYGGAAGTHGRVYPAQNGEIDIAFEYSLTQNWVIAADILGSWSGKTRFKGHATAPMTHPTSFQLSLAPALEYNWSEGLGIIFGSWFTIAGRNATQFYSGIFALSYYYNN